MMSAYHSMTTGAAGADDFSSRAEGLSDPPPEGLPGSA